MASSRISDIKGPAGPEGPAGPAGPNSIPTDTFMASKADDPTSEFAASLSAKVQEGLDAVRVSYVLTDPAIGGVVDGVTDNTAAFNAGLALVSAAGGGELIFPPGVTCIAGVTDPVPGSVTLRGTGMSYTSEPDETNPARGTVIRATAAMARLIQLSSIANSSGMQAGASIYDMTVDGNNFASTVVKAAGRRNRIVDTYVLRGTAIGIDWTIGQNGELAGYSVVDQRGVGDCVRWGASPDNKIFPGVQLRSAGADGACLHLLIDATGFGGGLVSGNDHIQGVHMWNGQNGESLPGTLIWIDARNGAQFQNFGIRDNMIEGCVGPQIKITADTTSVVRNVFITGNTFFNGIDVPDATHPVIQLEGAGSIVGLTIGPNTVQGGDQTHRYKSFVHDAGSGSRSRAWLDGNNGAFVQYPVTHAVAPGGGAGASQYLPEVGNNTFLASNTGPTTRRTHDDGSVTFTGNGSTSTFYIATTLGAKARRWNVTPRNAGAAIRNTYVDTDGATQLMVKFVDAAGAALAPGAGVSLVFQWEAWGY